MIRILLSAACLVSFSVLGVSSLNDGNKYLEDDRQQLWKKVTEAESKSLPKTGMQHAQKIYELAMQEQDYPEAVRALMKKLTLEASINQPATPYLIKKLGSEVDTYPETIRPVLKTILANWFYLYYQQNRWRFAQRSQTAQVPSDDFETWDLARLLNHVDSLFRDALQESDRLKQIPIGDYDALIRKGNVTDDHRPTLFDFIAFQALEFYALDEQIVRQQGAFDILADSPVFSSVEDFLAWQPQTEDADSFLLHAVGLYQQVLKFHSDDRDPTARLDADLHRLKFANQVALGSEKTERYKAALQRFVDANLQHPISSLAMASLAGVYQGQDDRVQAHRLASQGLKRHPDSTGGRQCYNVIQQIESRELYISTERVWNSAVPEINVSYRNLDQIHFRIIKFDYTNWNWGQRQLPTNLGTEELKKLLQGPRVTEWSQDLKPTTDYQKRDVPIQVNVELESGCYLLFASDRDDFVTEGNHLSVCEVWVSELGLVVRSDRADTRFSAQVVNAVTGQPIAGAEVALSQWVQNGRNSRSVDLPTTTTDANGMFFVDAIQRNRRSVPVRAIVRHEDQVLGMVDSRYRYRSQRDNRTRERTIFFTDRSLYRPGQTIHFKGICISQQQSESRYSTLTNRSAEVILRDVNGQEVERRKFRSNEFGSFSGTFTAPQGVATGRMTIQVDSGPNGSTGIRVEEYKRPKFVVDVEKPDRRIST